VPHLLRDREPAEIVVAETAQGRAILGVVDGASPRGVETDQDVAERKEVLRRFGDKL
jgi:adenosine/AMP kinase